MILNKPCETRRASALTPEEVIAIMPTAELDARTATDLRTLARLTGRPETELLREAVAAYREEIEDARGADEVLDRVESGEEATLTLDELDRRLGLGG